MKKILAILLALTLALSVGVAAMAEEETYAHEGISRVCASVFSLEESLDFFTNTMELELVAQGELDQQTCAALYGMDCAAKYAMLKNSVQDTLLQLIEFENTPEKTSREGYNSWDLGYYDIAFRCADIQQCFADLTEMGYTFLCEPYSYTTTWSGDTVFEAVLQGPNGMPLALINKTEATPAFEGMFRNFPDLSTERDDFMIVSPDEGALNRNMYYASVLGVELGMFYKRRDYSRMVDGRNPIVAHEYLGSDVAGKDVFVSDDIISSGESMLDIAYNLKERKAKRIFTYATYAIFTNGLESFDKAYQEGVIDGVFGSNLTYRKEELKDRPWFYEVDVSKYISYFISALNHDMSVSAMIDPHEKIKALLERRRQERSQEEGAQLTF